MEILIPVLVVLAIGVILGLGLSFADRFMSVPVDEKQIKIRDCLPGANCGACGYAGCDAMASAIAKGEAPTNGCPVGGQAVAEKVAAGAFPPDESLLRPLLENICYGNAQRIVSSEMV